MDAQNIRSALQFDMRTQRLIVDRELSGVATQLNHIIAQLKNPDDSAVTGIAARITTVIASLALAQGAAAHAEAVRAMLLMVSEAEGSRQ